MAFTKFFDPSVAQPAGDADTTYVFSADAVLAINVALTAGRPLLVQGPPGSGKSSIAAAVARVLDWRYYRHTVTANTQPHDLLYSFDTMRRSLDAQSASSRGAMLADFAYVEPGVFWWALDPASAERRGAPEGKWPPFAAVNPLAWPKEGSTAEGVVVLVDDIDKTSAELSESLLQVWMAREFYVKEVGTYARQTDPHPHASLLVLTVVGERELPLAVRRRCVVLTLPIPDVEQLMQIAAVHGLVDDRELTLRVAHQLRHDFQQRAWPLAVSDFLDALRVARTLEIEPGTPEWQIAVLPQLAFEEALSDQASITEPAQASHSCRVFLCHSSGDKLAVRQLYARLREEGFDAWLDEEKILPGQDWNAEIRRAVREADLVIVCLSKGSVGKTGYVQREISMVLDLADEQPEDKIYLIPARLEECDVPRRLTRWQWVDLFDPRGYNRLLSAVWTAAEGLELPATAGELAARRNLQANQYGSSQ
jgi:MoxR-like ATPase